MRLGWKDLLAVAAFLLLALNFQVVGAAGQPPAATSQGNSAPPDVGSGPQTGINSLVAPPPIQGSAQPMLFEQYGWLDYGNLTEQPSFPSSVNPINDEYDGWAEFWAGSLYVAGMVSVRITEWAFSLDLVGQLSGVVNGFTQGLESSLYDVYLPLVLVIAAIVAGWILLVLRRFMGGVLGIAWAALVITLSVQLFANPASYLNSADQFATGVTNSVIVGAAKYDPGAPPGSYQQPGGHNYEVRLLANRLFIGVVYDPWTFVEFGAVDPRVHGQQLGLQLLAKDEGQPNNYDSLIQQAPQWVQQWAQGNYGVQRATAGAFLFLMSLLMVLIVGLTALTVLVGGLCAVLIACFTVPAWLLGAIPRFGQRVIMQWFLGLVASLVVTTVAALYLVLVLGLLGALEAIENTVGLGAVIVLDIAVLVVALWLRKMFFSLGRHAARAPLQAATGQQPAGATASVQEANAVSRSAHRNVSRQRVRLADEVRNYREKGRFSWTKEEAEEEEAAGAGRAAANGAKGTTMRGAAAGVRKAGASARSASQAGSAGRAAAASTSTGPAAPATFAALLAAQGAAKVLHKGLEVHDAARRRVQAGAASAFTNTHATPGKPALVHHDPDEPGVLASGARVSVAGIQARRANRVGAVRESVERWEHGRWPWSPFGGDQVRPPGRRPVIRPPRTRTQRTAIHAGPPESKVRTVKK